MHQGPTSSIPPHGPAPDGAPQRSLFFDAHGLHPFWALLLYLAIVLTPRLLLGLATRMSDAGQPQPSGVIQISPLVAALNEWPLFGFVFFATWIMSRLEDRSPLDYGLSPKPRSVRRIVLGGVSGLLCMALLIGILWTTHHLTFDGVLLRPLPALTYGLAWAVDFLGVGLFEEFLFRGYLQFTLARCLAGVIRRVAPASRQATTIGFWAAAIVISFGFGLVHGGQPGESPIGLLCAGLAGLAFAFSLWRTGTLWWAIGFHAAWDWAQSYLFGVADSGTVSTGHLLASHPSGAVLLSGGATGPEGSVFVLPVVLLIALLIAFTLRRETTSGEAHTTDASQAFTTEAQVNSPRA